MIPLVLCFMRYVHNFNLLGLCFVYSKGRCIGKFWVPHMERVLLCQLIRPKNKEMTKSTNICKVYCVLIEISYIPLDFHILLIDVEGRVSLIFLIFWFFWRSGVRIGVRLNWNSCQKILYWGKLLPNRDDFIPST